MIRTIATLSLLAAAAAPALAAEPLNFHTLEFSQPRDPLVGSSPVYEDRHHSSAGDLAPALAALNAAVPAGMSRADAQAMLTRAGAGCAGDKCTFRDVQTVDEFVDDVTWTVTLATAGDTVTGLSVDRAWQRH